jgi:hypothetical protein
MTRGGLLFTLIGKNVDSDVRGDHGGPNELVAEIHDRMPLILALKDYARWLGVEADPHDLMRPFPSEPMPCSQSRRA